MNDDVQPDLSVAPVTSAEESFADVAPPERIGRYRIERVLGQGGFGIVYLARDDQLQRLVAIKVPHRHLVTQAAHADAYLTEARTVAALDHPHIVPVFDVGSSEDCPCFVVSKFIVTATLLANGQVLVVGGVGNSDNTLSSAELYSPATSKWTSVALMTTPRLGPTATLLPNGEVLVAMGYSIERNVYFASAELYNPAIESKTYDGTTNSAERPTVTGLIGNDSVTNLSQSYDTQNVRRRKDGKREPRFHRQRRQWRQ